jgi:hypothetical protein
MVVIKLCSPNLVSFRIPEVQEELYGHRREWLGLGLFQGVIMHFTWMKF